MKPYLDGFRELCKLLRHFGSTLSFAVDNLVGVLNVMDFHRKSERAGHYEHVELMIKYETKYKLVLRKVVVCDQFVLLGALYYRQSMPAPCK